MTIEERVLCRNPDPTKHGTRIPRWKHELVSAAIIRALESQPDGFPFMDLPSYVRSCLARNDRQKLGSISWHTTVVKLDLEARGLIERVPGAKPQRLRITGSRGR